MCKSALGRKRHRRCLCISIPLTILITATILILDVKGLCAHNPHDVVDDIAISPAYDQDQTLFIILSHRVLRSTDGGSSWKQLVKGLDFHGIMSTLAISPAYSIDRTLFLASRKHGIYRSQDRGDTWVLTSDGLDTQRTSLMAIHPASQFARPDPSRHATAQPGIVLVAGAEGGLYRTENGGGNWSQVLDTDISVTALTFSPDPECAVAFLGDKGGTLYISDDGGETWDQRPRLVQNTGAITAIAISPNFAADGTLFIGTEKKGIFGSINRGTSFIQANSGLPFTFPDRWGTFRTSRDGPPLRQSEQNVISIAISPDYARDSTLFASLWNQAIFRSQNGGKTWKRYQLGLTCNYQADSDTYQLPHFGAIKLSNAYSAIGDPAEGNTQRDGTAFLGGFDGLFKSVDGGEHWTQIETLPVRLMAGLALSPENSGLPLITITTYGGGAYTSCDAGETWNIQNDNLTLTRLTDIAFSPNYALDHTILTASGGRLIRSVSDGSDWIEYELGYQGWRAAVASRLSQVGVPDPLTRMLLNPFKHSPYAMVLAISPDFSSDGILYFGTRQHGIFKSSDRGQTTSVIWDGKLDASPPTTSRSPARISSLAISSNYTEDRTLFAGVHGEGVLKTVDGGENWQFVLRLVEQWKSLGKDETSRGHKPEKHHVWLALSPHYASDQTLFAASGNRLFKSIDGGDNWEGLRMPALENRAYIAALAVSTDYSVEGKRYQNEHGGQMLLVSVQGKGLFQSSNGGSSFTQIGSELIDNNQVIHQIEFSPHYAGGAGITGDGDIIDADIQRNNAIYAASTEELFRSTDGGDTWQVLARPVRYEDAREVIRFEGKWQAFETYGASARTVTQSDVTGSKASLDFVGTGVRWIGARSTDSGIAHVYLDGRPVSKVDQYAPSWEAATTCFQVTDLAYAPHTITIETSGTRNAKSAGHYIHVDALDVFGTTTMVKMEEK